MSNAAAVMTSLGTIEIQERPTPSPTGRQVVVRPQAVGVCGSDAAYFLHGRIGDYVVDGPIVLGHEVAGIVESVGPQVTSLRPGDRVAVEPGAPCRQCRECLRGEYHLCPDLVFMATPPHDGALQQLVVVEEAMLYPLPDGMSFEQGALLEPLSVGLWACQRVGLEVGQSVLVTGAGPVGLLAAECARALGASDVTITDVVDWRLESARTRGFASARLEDLTDQRFDILIECSGAPGALAGGMGLLGTGGRAAMVGMPKQEVGLPLASFTARELSLFLVNRYRDTWPAAISLVASGRVNTDGLVTSRHGLADTGRCQPVSASPA